MVHLTEEALSELLDGGRVEGADEHLGGCPRCRGELETLGQLRAELRELPDLEAPPETWTQVAARLQVGDPGRRYRLSWPGRRVALQAAAMAAVFVIGLGLGRSFGPGTPAGGDQAGEAAQLASQEVRPATPLVDALEEVRRYGAQYDAALRNLERLARDRGTETGTPSVAAERLASLNALVDASRTALSADPADPVLNAYLFAALDERDAVLRELSASQGSGSRARWR